MIRFVGNRVKVIGTWLWPRLARISIWVPSEKPFLPAFQRFSAASAFGWGARPGKRHHHRGGRDPQNARPSDQGDRGGNWPTYEKVVADTERNSGWAEEALKYGLVARSSPPPARLAIWRRRSPVIAPRLAQITHSALCNGGAARRSISLCPQLLRRQWRRKAISRLEEQAHYIASWAWMPSGCRPSIPRPIAIGA